MKLFKQTIFILIICISTLYPQFYIAPQAGINGIASYTKDSGLDFGVNRGRLYGAEIGYKFFGFIGVKGSAMYANKEFNQTRQLTNINNNVVSDDLYTETLNMKNGAIELKGSILLSLGRYEISIGPQLDQLLTSVATGKQVFDTVNDSSVSVDYDFINDLAGEGAYSNYSEKDGNYFNESIFSINLGLSFMLIRSLYVELQTNYAVTDLINDYYEGAENFSTNPFDLILLISYRFNI